MRAGELKVQLHNRRRARALTWTSRLVSSITGVYKLGSVQFGKPSAGMRCPDFGAIPLVRPRGRIDITRSLVLGSLEANSCKTRTHPSEA